MVPNGHLAHCMRILNYFRILYYSLLLWVDDFGSDAKVSRPMQPAHIEQSRNNEKLRRGVRQLLKWMRGLSKEERQQLIDKDVNLLQSYRKERRQSVVDKLERARIAAKFTKSPQREGEESMAETFVKNQGKYKLLHRRKELHKEMRKADAVRQKEIAQELLQLRKELEKYDE